MMCGGEFSITVRHIINPHMYSVQMYNNSMAKEVSFTQIDSFDGKCEDELIPYDYRYYISIISAS